MFKNKNKTPSKKKGRQGGFSPIPRQVSGMSHELDECRAKALDFMKQAQEAKQEVTALTEVIPAAE